MHDEREVAVTDAGLKVRMNVHDWDTFDDYGSNVELSGVSVSGDASGDRCWRAKLDVGLYELASSTNEREECD